MSCRNFYRPVLNPQTRSFLWKCGFWGAENEKNSSWDKKSIFSKCKISIHQSNHGKTNIKPMLVRAYKRFRATWGVCKIIVKFQFLPFTNIFLWDFPREMFFGRAKNRKFWIIAETTQLVLKCFWGQNNMCLMLLFAWLDWCIDILDFEKIQFFVSRAIFGVFSQAILGPNLKLNLWALCVFS